jgi:hypothetical protein
VRAVTAPALPASPPSAPGDAPVGTPGPWTVFRHFLGGDDIAVQATPEVATAFLTHALGFDLDDCCTCEFGCGPIWNEIEGDGPDHAHPTRPALVHDEQGLRFDGTCRSTLYLAEVVAAAPQPSTPAPAHDSAATHTPIRPS